MQLLNEVQNQMESLRRRQQEIMTANEVKYINYSCN